MENQFWVLNALSIVATFYFIISVPMQIFIRLKRKRNGQVVTPFKFIIKKLLKYWLITAVILIPLSSMLVYEYLEANGAPNRVKASALLDTTLGNIPTSLMIGYGFLMLFRYKWSHSLNNYNFEKNNRLK